MKTNSMLLICLLTSCCLVSCTSMNKSTALNNNFQAKQNIIVSTDADLIKAQRPDQYYEIGRQYQKNGNYSNAVIAYQKSLQLDSSYVKSITGLASVFADQKLYVLAIPLFEQVTNIEPNVASYNNLGYAYYLNNQYAEATRVLSQAIMIEPGYLQAQNNLKLVANNQPPSVGSGSNQLAQEVNKPVLSNPLLINKEVNSSSPIELQNINQKLTNSADLVQLEPKIVQTGNGIYELGIQRPTVKTATKENINELQAHKQSKNKLNIYKDLSASISGGITFKYTPALNKLFDLASSGISKLVASDNTKFVEIINGNGIKGFARAVANKMQVNGNAQLKISDAKRFNQMTTHIQYRSGYRDDAVKLNQNLLNKPYLVRNDNLPSNVAIRLVLGRDLLQQSNKSAMTNLHPEEEAS